MSKLVIMHFHSFEHSCLLTLNYPAFQRTITDKTKHLYSGIVLTVFKYQSSDHSNTCHQSTPFFCYLTLGSCTYLNVVDFHSSKTTVFPNLSGNSMHSRSIHASCNIFLPWQSVAVSKSCNYQPISFFIWLTPALMTRSAAGIPFFFNFSTSSIRRRLFDPFYSVPVFFSCPCHTTGQLFACNCILTLSLGFHHPVPSTSTFRCFSHSYLQNRSSTPYVLQNSVIKQTPSFDCSAWRLARHHLSLWAASCQSLKTFVSHITAQFNSYLSYDVLKNFLFIFIRLTASASIRL